MRQRHCNQMHETPYWRRITVPTAVYGHRVEEHLFLSANNEQSLSLHITPSTEWTNETRAGRRRRERLRLCAAVAVNLFAPTRLYVCAEIPYNLIINWMCVHCTIAPLPLSHAIRTLLRIAHRSANMRCMNENYIAFRRFKFMKNMHTRL